jgi:hypothetical protein
MQLGQRPQASFSETMQLRAWATVTAASTLPTPARPKKIMLRGSFPEPTNRFSRAMTAAFPVRSEKAIVPR